MKVLTKTLIKRSEEDAVASGNFSYRRLMYNAGNACAEIIESRFECKNKKIAVICGNGNNGGDGFVTASRLFELGADVTVVTPLGLPVTENARYYYDKLGFITKTCELIGEFDIIIDALFGIGLNRPLDTNICALIEELNRKNAVRISVDIPSGVEADSGEILGAAFKADLTVTFIALKPCFMLPQGSDHCGTVAVADIGVTPTEYSFLTNEKPIFKKRNHNAHKGSYGTALLLCGSYGMAGAAILAARAALRSGVGIVKCVICDSIYSPFTCAVPEAVCIPVKPNSVGTFSDNTDLDKALERSAAVLFGCGVGCNEDTAALLENLITTAAVPLVIDADGINALSCRIDILKKSKAPIILTPHPGEMARLCNTTVAQVESNRIEVAREFAKQHNCYLVLKGADTVIAEPSGEICINLNGNPGMAKGGSGDVLAGITVSLLAQGIEVGTAVKAAVYLHGEAGDKACLRKGERAMLPSDIINEL